MDKPYTRCTYDVVFKFLMVRQLRLISEIIKGATGILCKEINIMNPNILPDSNNEKNMECDVLVRNELGYFFDIEMQNSRLTTPLAQRIQYYASQIIALQTKVGQPYNLKPAYCIVLINKGTKYTQLIESHVLSSEHGIMRGNLIHIIFVYLPFINVLAKQKGLRELNMFERIIYAFHNNLSYDILELGDEVISIMSENKNAFYLNECGLLTLAEKKWWDAYIEQEREKEIQLMEQRTKELEERSKQLEKINRQFEEESKILEQQLEQQSKKLAQESKKFEQESKKFEQESKKFEQESKKFEQESKKFEQESKKFQQENLRLNETLRLHIQSAMKKLNLSYDEAVAFFTE